MNQRDLDDDLVRIISHISGVGCTERKMGRYHVELPVLLECLL